MIVGFKEGNRYRLGDQVTVRVAKVDLQDRQLYLEIVKNHSARRDASMGGRSKTSRTNYKSKRKSDRRSKKKRKKRR